MSLHLPLPNLPLADISLALLFISLRSGLPFIYRYNHVLIIPIIAEQFFLQLLTKRVYFYMRYCLIIFPFSVYIFLLIINFDQPYIYFFIYYFLCWFIKCINFYNFLISSNYYIKLLCTKLLHLGGLKLPIGLSPFPQFQVASSRQVWEDQAEKISHRQCNSLQIYVNRKVGIKLLKHQVFSLYF